MRAERRGAPCMFEITGRRLQLGAAGDARRRACARAAQRRPLARALRAAAAGACCRRHPRAGRWPRRRCRQGQRCRQLRGRRRRRGGGSRCRAGAGGRPAGLGAAPVDPHGGGQRRRQCSFLPACLPACIHTCMYLLVQSMHAQVAALCKAERCCSVPELRCQKSTRLTLCMPPRPAAGRPQGRRRCRRVRPAACCRRATRLRTA